jgi:hypothetical protein
VHVALSDQQRQDLEAAKASLVTAKSNIDAATGKIQAALDWTEPTTPPPSTSLPTKMQSYWIHWNSTSTTDTMLQQEAARRKYVLLNAWEGSIARRLKELNPSIQCYVYKDASSTRSYDSNTNYAMLPAGVSYHYANNNQPSWFLTDSNGNRLQYSGYSGHWQMDIGNTGYQQEWYKNVAACVVSEGFDGVIMDNCPLWSRDAYHPGVAPAKYTTDDAFRNAYESFMSYVRTQSQGKFKLMANMTNARLVTGGWNRFMAYLDGAWDEWWISVNNNGTDLLAEYTSGWQRQVQEIEDNEEAGKFTLVQPHFPGGTPGQPFWYSYASFLAGYGGRSAFVEATGTDQYGNPMPWRPQYDWDLGAPQGAYYRAVTNSNIFRRDFAKGAVIINANNTTASTTVNLGSTFVDENGNTISGSISIPGKTGRVLRT